MGLLTVAAALPPTTAPAAEFHSPAAQQQLTFANPLYSGADPWLTQRDGWYYLCQSGRRGIDVWKSRRITDRGELATVWHAPAQGWNSQQIWAPELHYLRGRWYIYYAASDGDNANHRTGVLESLTDDPQGAYVDRGILYTGDDLEHRTKNRWAIDGTVFELAGKLFFVWSGWQDTRDIQHLYIARMENPWTIASSRVRLCANDTYDWERVGDDPRQRGLHEGPAVLLHNGRVFIVFSCSGSWQSTYKLALLWADAKADLLEPKSWTKLDHPVFASTADVFGVGHCSFVKSPDGQEDWMLYHSKAFRHEGWQRLVRAQKFTWTEDNLPDFGRPIPPARPIAAPSGQPR